MEVELLDNGNTLLRIIIHHAMYDIYIKIQEGKLGHKENIHHKWSYKSINEVIHIMEITTRIYQSTTYDYCIHKITSMVLASYL